MTIDERFEDFIKSVQNFNFDYIITSDLEIWKKGVNQEYLIRKKLKELLNELGIEATTQLYKIILDKVNFVMLYDIERKTIENWFLPYIHIVNNFSKEKENAPSQYKLYKANQDKLHDKKSPELKTNYKGFQ